MKKTIKYFWGLLFFGQNMLAQHSVLDSYIAQAIASHQGISQQNHIVEKTKIQAQSAKTLYKPSANFNTTYSTAKGGRSISFPVGDLINPVYSTLNKLTPAGSPKFPENAVPNVNEQLVPKNFYDMRLKTTMPLYNKDIAYNQRIKTDLVALQAIDIDIAKRDLMRDIKIAYFNLLKTHDAIKIYDNALKLLAETERVNKSLIKNEMASNLALLRTQNEISRVKSDADLAQNNLLNAKIYFNFLLSRDYHEEIILDSTYHNLPIIETSNVAQPREEIKKLDAALKVQQSVLALNQAYRKPKIGGLIDLGSQGSVKDISSKNPFILFGLSFDLPVYQGGRNLLKIKEQEQEILALTAQENQVKQQLSVQVEIAKNNYLAAVNTLNAKKTQINTADRIYQEIAKKYKEGQSNYVELFEAHTNLTNSGLQLGIAKYDIWIKHTEWERAK